MTGLPADVEVGKARLAVWREHPDAFVIDNWPHVKLEVFQQKACDYCKTPGRKRIAMQSAVGTGKTAWLAWMGLHRLSSFMSKGEYPKGVALSVDRPNLKMNLWPELCKWLAESPYLNRMFATTADRISCKAEATDRWFLEARSWPKRATGAEQAASLSGLHSAYPFALIDEAAEIDIAVIDRTEQMYSGCVDGLIAVTGNPISRLGVLYEVCVKRKGGSWFVLEISGDPDDPDRCTRVDIDWARERIKNANGGRGDPWIQAQIFGKFPDADMFSLLTDEEVTQAMSRSYRQEHVNHYAKILGVDVAGQGLDSSVIAPRQGLIAFQMDQYRGLDPNEGAATVARKWSSWGAHAAFVDNTGGFGSGWIAQLRNLGYSPMPVEFSAKATSAEFYNKRAEMIWRLREAVKAGLSLPNDPELARELTTPTYLHKKGQLLIEDKDSIKARLKRSPDKLDALALTYAFDVAPPLDDPMYPDGREWNRNRPQIAQRVLEPRGW